MSLEIRTQSAPRQHVYESLFLGLLVCLLSLPVYAQTTTGRILGTITDATGATVNGAVVTVTDVERGTVRTFTTESGGAYAAPNLQPGQYKVRVEAKGFRSVERTNIQLEVATDALIDVALQPGNVVDVVTVTEEVPLINATSATLGGTLSNKEINDLPLNGRNYENLLQLRPGIVRYPGGGFSTTSSNGLRAEDNVYLVDGLFNSEPFSGQSIINGAGIAGDSATILPVDAIQEFNVLGNPPAEYGWKPGTIVNVGLKSGTNSLHGTGFAFGRDTPFDARNYFNPKPDEKNPRDLEQFGGSAGGTIVKDKLFYFGSYEGQRYTVGNAGKLDTYVMAPLPTPDPLNPNCAFIPAGDCVNSIVDALNDVHAAFLAAVIPRDVSTTSLKIAGCTMGPPISCDGSGFPLNDGANGTTINFGLPNTVKADNAVGKIDYHLSDRSTFSGVYFFGNNSGTVSDASQLQTKWLTQIHTRAQVFGGNWTWVPSSRWVNEARFGYNRLYQPTFTNDHTQLASSYGLDTGVTNPLYGGLPRISVFPLYIFPQEFGGFNWPKVQGPDTRIQFIDHISYIKGNHAIKFGGELHHDAFNGGAYGGSRGRVKFIDSESFTTPITASSGLEDFFAGFPTVATQLVGDPTRHIHNWGFAGFVQDDWRVSRTVTVNLGLRYELNTVIKEEHNLLGNFSPAAGLQQVGQGIKGPYDGDHANFAPRLGIAWDLTGNGRTVVRAGGGLMYETLNWQSFLALNNSLGLSTIPTGALGVGPGNTQGTGSIAVGTINVPDVNLDWDNVNGPLFPVGKIDCGANPCSILGVVPNLKTPRVWNWNLDLQHAFTNNLSLDVAYVGNRGTKLAGIRDINQNIPALDVLGDEQSGRPLNGQYPYLSFIYQMENIYKSNYNGLQTTLTAKNFHGLTAILGYTYAHALDDVGANWDFGAGLGLPSDNNHPEREYASSDFDIRHRFTLSLTYALPGRKSFAQLLEGWQINSIISLYSAQPFGVMDAGSDSSLTGEANDRWDFFGDSKDFKSTTEGIPFFAGSTDPANPTSNATCNAQALALDGGTPGGPASTALSNFGCFQNGKSFMIPPVPGTFGTMGRNIFRDTGFRNVDLSVAKNWKFGERYGAQFRVEFFNVLNHPNFANPFGGQNGWAHNDPSSGSFGCSCATPDTSATNPIIGSGGSRAVQLGLKLLVLGRSKEIVQGLTTNRNGPDAQTSGPPPLAGHPFRTTERDSLMLRTALPRAILLTTTLICVTAAGFSTERTLDEIKAEAVHRAENGMYPLIGLDPADVREAFASIHTSDKDEWAAGFMGVAVRYMAEGKSLEKSDPAKANADYIRAWRLYSFGRWPVPASPGKKQSYAKAIEAFLAHAQFYDPPLEVVRIPFEGKTITGYLRLPKNASGPVPLVLAINGLDSRKEDLTENFSGILAFGVGYLAVDGPGTGQAPIQVSETGDRMLSRVIDYIETRPEVDKTRIAVHGVSWGAYWATKLSIVEHARLRAVTAQSPAIHAFFQKEFIEGKLVGNREYLFDQIPALMSVYDGVTTLDELVAAAPKMSLKAQGLLDKPTTPMLVIGGTLDTQVPISEAYLLLDSGDVPKEAWINPKGGHLGRQVKVWPDPVIFKQVIIPWLLRALDVPAPKASAPR